jgi:hypothetical protein
MVTAVVRISMAAVALAAAVLSFSSLARLGELAGYGALAFLYPVVVDAGAAASCAAWLHTRGRQPFAMTWCLLGISVVLNGTTHYLESTHTAPSWALVVAVAAVPPTVLGLCVHLAVGIGRPAQTEVGRVVRDAAPASATYSAGERTLSTVSDDPLAELVAQGAGRRKVADVLGVSEHQARKLLDAHRNGAES